MPNMFENSLQKAIDTQAIDNMMRQQTTQNVQNVAPLNLPAASIPGIIRDPIKGMVLPFAKLATGDGTAKNLMNAYGVNPTGTNGGVLNEDVGDINMLAGGVVQGGLMSGVVRGGAGLAASAASKFINPTSKLINVSNTLGKVGSLAETGIDLGAQSSMYSLGNVNEVSVRDGKATAKRDMSKFADAFKMNAAFMGAFSTTIGGTIFSIKKGVRARNYRRQVSVGDKSLLSLDSDGVSIFNHNLLNSAEAQKLGIKLDENGFITLEDFNKLSGQEFKTIDEMKAALGDNKVEAAVLDPNTNEFFMSSEAFGDATGTKLGSGAKILDLTKSNVNKNMYDLKFGGRSMLNGLDEATVNAMKVIDEMRTNTESSAYTKTSAYTTKIDDNGEVVGNKEARRGGVTEFNNKDIIEKSGYEKPDEVTFPDRERSIYAQMLLAKGFKNIKALDDKEGALSDFKTLYENLMGNTESGNNLSGAIKNIFDNENSTSITFTEDSPTADVYKMFFNGTEKLDGKGKVAGFEVSGMKEEFRNALQAALGITLIKLPNSADGYVGKNIVQSILRQATDLMGIKDKTILTESMLNDMVSKSDTTLDAMFRDTTNSKTVVEDGTPITKSPLADWVNTLRDTFGNSEAVRTDTINNILSKGYDSEKYGINFSGKAGKVINKAGVTAEGALELANVMANTKMTFTEEGISHIGYLSALVEGLKDERVQFEFAKVVGAIDPDMELGTFMSMHPNGKNAITDKIYSAKREVDDINRMLADYGGNEFTFDVDVMDITRVGYAGATNPLSSTILRSILSTNKSKIKIDFESKSSDMLDNIESAQRAILSNFGIKVEGVHDSANKIKSEFDNKSASDIIDHLFNNLKNTLLVKEGDKYKIKDELYKETINDGKLHINMAKLDKALKGLTKKSAGKYLKFDIENILSLTSLHEMVNMLNSKGDYVHIFKEIDASNSGYSIVKSGLGYLEPRTGIGSKIDITVDDPYKELAGILGITRKEAKTLFIPKNYEAGISGVTDAYTLSMLNDYFQTGKMNGELKNLLNSFQGMKNKSFEMYLEMLKDVDEGNDLKKIKKDLDIKNVASDEELANVIGEKLKANSLSAQTVKHIAALQSAIDDKSLIIQAIEKVFAKDEELTQNELDGLVNFLRPKYMNDIKNAFAKLDENNYAVELSDGEFNLKHDYDSAINKLTQLSTEVFYKNYLKKDIPGDTIMSRLDGALKDTGLEIDESHLKAMRDKLGNTSSVSVSDIINVMSKYGYFKSDMTSIRMLNDIIPEIKVADGKTIKLITSKGYANNTDHVSHVGPTLQTTFQPVFTLSQDAIVASKAVADGYLNIQDALVGIDGVQERARVANETISKLIHDVNYGTNILDAITSLFGKDNTETNLVLSQISSKEKSMIAKEIARQKYYKNNGGKEPSPEILDIMAKDEESNLMLGKSENIENFKDEASALSKHIYENKQKNFGDDTEINNVSDGMDINTARYSDETVSFRSTDDKVVNSELSTSKKTLTMDKLKKASTKLGRFIVRVKHSISSSKHGVDIKSFKIGGDSSFASKIGEGDNVSFAVQIGHDKFTPESHRELIHEIIHILSKKQEFLLSGEAHGKGAETTLSGLIKDLSDKQAINMTPDGTKTGLSTDIEGEALSQLFERLIANEEILLNKDDFATAFVKGTDAKTIDLAQHIKPIKIDGVDIITPEHFRDYLKSKGYELASNQLDDLLARYSATLNSNPDILAFMNGQPTVKFKSSMKGIIKNINDSNNKTMRAIDDKLTTIGLSDIFTLSPQREALESILGLKAQHETTMVNMTIALLKGLQDKVTKNDYEGNFDADIGTLAVFGVHKFLKDFMSSNSRAVFENKMIKRHIAIKDNIRTLFKHFNHSTKTKDFLNEIKNIDTIAEVDKLATKYAKMLEQDPHQQIRLYDLLTAVIKREHAISSAVSKPSLARVESFYKKVANQPELKNDAAELLTMLEKEHSNPHSILGTNIEMNTNGSSKRGYASLDKPDAEKLIGTAIVNGQTVYIVAQDVESHVFAAERGQLMTYDVTDDMKGLYSYKGADGDLISLNPRHVNFESEHINPSISTQIAKNAYLKNYEDTAGKLVHKTQQTLLSAGVLVPESEFSKLPPEIQKGYVKTSKEIAEKSLGGTYYYKKSWNKYFAGTKGIDLSNDAMAKVVGKDVANVVMPMARLVIKYIEQLKRLILNYRPASYINSFVSSMLTYLVNGSDIHNIKAHMGEARKLMKEYKSILNDSVNMTTEAGRKGALARLEAHPLHEVFLSGLFNNVRSDAYSTGSLQENALVASLSHIYKDEGAGLAFKTLLADPTTKAGSMIGDLYDMTEVLPKIMMYLSREKRVGKQAAIQETLLAFPTYNNMGPILGTIDLISPYTKYLANYPKMLMFALSENKTRLAAISALLPLMVRGSYSSEVDKKDKWFYDNGFIKVSDNSFKSTGSLSPYNLPFKGVTGDKIFDPTFAVSATESIMNIGGLLNPLTVRR